MFSVYANRTDIACVELDRFEGELQAFCRLKPPVKLDFSAKIAQNRKFLARNPLKLPFFSCFNRVLAAPRRDARPPTLEGSSGAAKLPLGPRVGGAFERVRPGCVARQSRMKLCGKLLG